MVDTSELLTIAELAVAFAGFSAIVTVIGSRASSVDPRRIAFGLRSLVEVSLVVAALSVFPLLPHKLTLADETVWRIPSVVYLAVRAAGTFFATRRFRTIEHLGGSVELVLRRSAMWPLVVLSNIALLAVASGQLPAANSALYFSALYIDLVIAGVLFVHVVSLVL